MLFVVDSTWKTFKIETEIGYSKVMYIYINVLCITFCTGYILYTLYANRLNLLSHSIDFIFSFKGIDRDRLLLFFMSLNIRNLIEWCKCVYVCVYYS